MLVPCPKCLDNPGRTSIGPPSATKPCRTCKGTGTLAPRGISPRRESVVSDQMFRDAARRLHHRDGECEIDDMPDQPAPVSRHNDGDGAYVQAWVWVPRCELPR